VKKQNFYYDPRIDLNDKEVIEGLLKESPANFMQILADEIKAYAELIGSCAVLTGEDENVQGIGISGFSKDGQNMTVTEVMTAINQHSKSIEKFMDIALIFSEKFRQGE